MGVRARDIYTFAKKKNIDPSVVKESLNKTFPFIQNKAYSGNKNPSRNYLTTRVYNFGFLMADLSYFGADYGPTPKNIIGFVLMVDILSHRCWVELLKKNKSAKAFVTTFKKLIKRYTTDTKQSINTISTDMEMSVNSKEFKKFIFEKNKIDLVLFENTKKKSYFSELFIQIFKRLYIQNKTAWSGKGRYPPMFKKLGDLEKTINNRPIYIDGKVSEFKPSTLKKNNLDRYLEKINQADHSKYVSNFYYRSDFYKFKFEIGDLCFVKLNTIVPANILKYRGTNRSISKKIFKVEKLFLYVSKQMVLNPAACCSQIYPKRKKNILGNNIFFFPTNNLVKVPTSMEKDILNNINNNIINIKNIDNNNNNNNINTLD